MQPSSTPYSVTPIASSLSPPASFAERRPPRGGVAKHAALGGSRFDSASLLHAPLAPRYSLGFLFATPADVPGSVAAPSARCTARRYRGGPCGLQKESSVLERSLRAREGVVGFGKEPSVRKRRHQFRKGGIGLEKEASVWERSLRSRKGVTVLNDASSFSKTPPRSIRRLPVRSNASSCDLTRHHPLPRLLIRPRASLSAPTPPHSIRRLLARFEASSASRSPHRGSARSMRLMRTARVRMHCATASSTTPSVAARSTAPTT